MGIGGAVLYGLVVMAGRKLSRLSMRANRLLASIWHMSLEGAALSGASFHALPHDSVQSSDEQHEGERS